jgi:hypothetical protein
MGLRQKKKGQGFMETHSFLFFCKRILTAQLTILQNLKQFKLVNLYLQGFED